MMKMITIAMKMKESTKTFKMKLYSFNLAISILLIMTTPFCSILTWNVRGIMSSAGSLSKLLDSHNIDLAFISEHKLRNEHNTFFDSIHSNYRALTICDTSTVPGARCGKGGVAIMYKKDCQFSVTPIDIHVSDRILGVKIDCRDTRTIYAFSVYMPSVNYSSDDYKDCLECLQNLYDTFSCYGTVLFLGDFNCDIHQTKCNDDRSKSLSLFLETTQMSACPLEGCYTFRPTNKILDYVITDTYQHELKHVTKSLMKTFAWFQTIYQYTHC